MTSSSRRDKGVWQGPKEEAPLTPTKARQVVKRAKKFVEPNTSMHLDNNPGLNLYNPAPAQMPTIKRNSNNMVRHSKRSIIKGIQGASVRARNVPITLPKLSWENDD